jgi:hypothetical protein
MEISLGKRSYLGKGRRSKDSLSRILQVHLTPKLWDEVFVKGGSL